MTSLVLLSRIPENQCKGKYDAIVMPFSREHMGQIRQREHLLMGLPGVQKIHFDAPIGTEAMTIVGQGNAALDLSEVLEETGYCLVTFQEYQKYLADKVIQPHKLSTSSQVYYVGGEAILVLDGWISKSGENVEGLSIFINDLDRYLEERYG